MRQKFSNAKHDKIARATRGVAYRFVGVQAVVFLVIALLWLIKGVVPSYSAILGGLACVLPSFYFARRLFSTVSPGAAKKILLNFFTGEIVKLLVSAVLLILVIRWARVEIVACITGYLGAQFGFWFAPLLVKLDPVKSISG